MAQFATAAEFADRLGLTLTGGETTRANALLTLASGLIQDATRQRIEAVADDDLIRIGAWGPSLRLPERPVMNVDSITIDGVPLPAGEWNLEGDEIFRDVGWDGPDAELAIQYDHGYAVVPAVVKSVCMEAVVRVWVNPGAVIQEGYGTEQVSYVSGNGLLLSETEQRAVRQAVARTVGSVELR